MHPSFRSQLFALSALAFGGAFFDTETPATRLDEATMSQVKGGALYYCATAVPHPYLPGCTQCVSIGTYYWWPNWGEPTPVTLWKKCTSTNPSNVCYLANWPPVMGATPTCNRDGSAACGGSANLYIDSTCTMGPGTLMLPPGQWNPNNPPSTSCNLTYEVASSGPMAPGVNCDSVSPEYR